MGPIASVFGYIMDFLFRITSSMGIMNIGLCIILFTIITKLLLFPLTIKQQESSKLMSLMNPEIKAVQRLTGCFNGIFQIGKVSNLAYPALTPRLFSW